MAGLASITKVGDTYVLDYKDRSFVVDETQLRKLLGQNDDIPTLEAKINNWLAQRTAPGETLLIHIFSETPIDFKIGRFYAANGPVPGDWWREPESR